MAFTREVSAIEAVRTRAVVARPAEMPLDFDRLYAVQAQRVARWVRRLGGPGFDVEDAVQEIFMVAARKLETFEPRADVGSWLFGIARNVVHRHRRALRWSRFFDATRSAIEVAGDETTAPDVLYRQEQEARLYRVLDGLPEKYRVPVILFELEEVPGDEIARLLGLKPSACWTLIRRGRQKLAQRLIALERSEGQDILRGRS